MRIDNINKKQFSKDSIYRILKSFDIIYGEFTDAEKKRFINVFVEKVEIYEEEREDGRFLKSIKFRFPKYYNGAETLELDLSDKNWDYQRSLETVCLLSKLSNAEHHIDVTVNTDEMDLTSAESKATYEEIKAYVKEHSGLIVSSLNVAQVKRKYGIIERGNYNLPKNKNARQPKCSPEKEQAIVLALKYFDMIPNK